MNNFLRKTLLSVAFLSVFSMSQEPVAFTEGNDGLAKRLLAQGKCVTPFGELYDCSKLTKCATTLMDCTGLFSEDQCSANKQHVLKSKNREIIQLETGMSNKRMSLNNAYMLAIVDFKGQKYLSPYMAMINCEGAPCEDLSRQMTNAIPEMVRPKSNIPLPVSFMIPIDTFRKYFKGGQDYAMQKMAEALANEDEEKWGEVQNYLISANATAFLLGLSSAGCSD